MSGTLHVTKPREQKKMQLPESFLEGIDLLKATEAMLCGMHIEAKAAEKVLNADRIRIEQELIARLGLPEIGKQKTYTPAGFRVVIKADASYKMDWPKWGEIRGEIPESLRPTKWIEAIDKSKVKYLRSAEPTTFAQLSQALTTTPLKPSVEVEPYVAAPAPERIA